MFKSVLFMLFLDRFHQINTRVLDRLFLVLLQRLVGRLKFVRLHPELELNLTNLQFPAWDDLIGSLYKPGN